MHGGNRMLSPPQQRAKSISMGTKLGTEIRAERLRQHPTLKGLAAKANCDPSTIWRIESGKTETPNSLRDVALALGREDLLRAPASPVAEHRRAPDWISETIKATFIDMALADACDPDPSVRVEIARRLNALRPDNTQWGNVEYWYRNFSETRAAVQAAKSADESSMRRRVR